MKTIATSRYRWQCEDAHDCLQTELMRFFLDQRSYPKSEAPSDYRETNLQELTNENSAEFQLIFTEGFTSAQIEKINFLLYDHMKRFNEHEEILKLWETFTMHVKRTDLHLYWQVSVPGFGEREYHCFSTYSKAQKWIGCWINDYIKLYDTVPCQSINMQVKVFNKNRPPRKIDETPYKKWLKIRTTKNKEG